MSDDRLPVFAAKETIFQRINRLQREWAHDNNPDKPRPIHPETARLARTIAAALLPQKPFVGPTSDGELDFEWDDDKGGTYIVSVVYLEPLT